jgi:hypothetical protein
VRTLDFAITVGTVETPDQSLDFQLTDTDADGDSVVSNSFNVLVDNPLI